MNLPNPNATDKVHKIVVDNRISHMYFTWRHCLEMSRISPATLRNKHQSALLSYIVLMRYPYESTFSCIHTNDMEQFQAYALDGICLAPRRNYNDSLSPYQFSSESLRRKSRRVNVFCIPQVPVISEVDKFLNVCFEACTSRGVLRDGFEKTRADVAAFPWLEGYDVELMKQLMKFIACCAKSKDTVVSSAVETRLVMPENAITVFICAICSRISLQSLFRLQTWSFLTPLMVDNNEPSPTKVR